MCQDYVGRFWVYFAVRRPRYNSTCRPCRPISKHDIYYLGDDVLTVKSLNTGGQCSKYKQHGVELAGNCEKFEENMFNPRRWNNFISLKQYIAYNMLPSF